MGKYPKVSVLMLTYNHEKYIDEAIRSVLLQETDFDFELVIGNDCSTDTTAEHCLGWMERHPEQVILFNREQNQGLQQNFMQTYAHCRGEYIAICEGDDFWTDKCKLQKQVDFLDTHPEYSTCFHRVINYYQDKGTKSLSNGGQQVVTDILDLAKSNYISNVSAVFRRGLFGPLPDWFAQVSTYDYAIHLLNAQYGKIYYMKKPMAVYRQHGEAIWSKAKVDKKLLIALKIRELLMAYFKENTEVYRALRSAYSSIALNLIRYYRNRGQIEAKESLESLLFSYFPEWSLAEIRYRARNIPLTKKERMHKTLRKVLTWGRELVSRFVPLPRI